MTERKPRAKKVKKVTAKDIETPDPLEKVVAKYMSIEDTVRQYAEGAKQDKRNQYKFGCLGVMAAMQGIKPTDKILVGTLEQEIKSLTEEDLDKRLGQLESETA